MITPKYSGRNVSGVKAQNIKAILMNLLFREPVYRVDLAKDISVSTTTVTNLIDELIEQGIVREGINGDNGDRTVGRPKSALFLINNACYAVGIYIGGKEYWVGIVNLRDEVVHSFQGEFESKIPWKALLERIYEKLVLMLEESRIDRRKIIGIGIGAPGLVEFNTGMIYYSKNLGWSEVPVKEFFQEKFDFPVVVENNVRAMALGEALFGFGRGVDNLMFVHGSLGVGAGLVVDHEIYRGMGQGAGEIGHTYITQSDEFGDDNNCCLTLEELISVPGILLKAVELAKQEPESEFAQEIIHLNDDEKLDKIFQLAQESNPQANILVQRTSRYLGLALVNAINFINPELILLGGIYADQFDLFMPTIREMVNKLSFANIGEKVEIRATKFGHQAGLVGAGALALARFFYLPPENLDISGTIGYAINSKPFKHLEQLREI